MSDEPVLAPEPPLAGTEAQALAGSLDRMRHTFRWKCADLDAGAMAVTVGASAITLGGLVRHLTRCEAHAFGWKLSGLPDTSTPQDWAADWAWSADGDVAELWRGWNAAVVQSQRLLAAALADGGPDRPGRTFPGWGTPNARRILLDTIEEYSRHTGHADLIREAVDGRVGEDAPPLDVPR